MNQDIFPALNAQRGTWWTLYSSSFIAFFLLAPQCFGYRLPLSVGLLSSFPNRHALFEQLHIGNDASKYGGCILNMESLARVSPSKESLSLVTVRVQQWYT